jgi:hypothetical protein
VNNSVKISQKLFSQIFSGNLLPASAYKTTDFVPDGVECLSVGVVCGSVGVGLDGLDVQHAGRAAGVAHHQVVFRLGQQTGAYSTPTWTLIPRETGQ